MTNINMTTEIICFKFLSFKKNKVALISCSWSKAPSKATQNNGLMALIRAQLGVAWHEWGQRKVRTSSQGSQIQMGNVGWWHVLPMLGGDRQSQCITSCDIDLIIQVYSGWLWKQVELKYENNASS